MIYLKIHPGETLRDVMEDRGLTVRDISRKSWHSSAHIENVISGKADIDLSLAIELEKILGIDSTFWLNLQENYNKESVNAKKK